MGGSPFPELIDMFLESPRCFSVYKHFLLESCVESGDKLLDEISFFCQASFSLKNQEVCEILFKETFALEETF